MPKQLEFLIDESANRKPTNVIDVITLAEPVRAAEFFAGIGLVRCALEKSGAEVHWANDIEPLKQRVYEENFGAADFHLGDVCEVIGNDIPNIDIATASFPCTDLSLAGSRRGLAGEHSGMFWEFVRVIEEMGTRKPKMVFLENVPGFATSNDGKDLRNAIQRLNELGYCCDIIQVDAKWFVPQSRQRLFVVGVLERVAQRSVRPDAVRPRHLLDFALANPKLDLQALHFPSPPRMAHQLEDVVERFRSNHEIWWDDERTSQFLRSLTPVQVDRLNTLSAERTTTHRTAYRRTRGGVPQWEIRPDSIAGCLRTARGGSSKQAVVKVGREKVQVRWMTAREYARLQGVDDSFTFDTVSSNQALFGFGDAVCVPAVEWVVQWSLRTLDLLTMTEAS
jgi:DNA (cytosine-5)-methyltransferase 1